MDEAPTYFPVVYFECIAHKVTISNLDKFIQWLEFSYPRYIVNVDIEMIEIAYHGSREEDGVNAEILGNIIGTFYMMIFNCVPAPISSI